jgi:nucleotide-binding universal stress UspA family protein
MHANVFLLHVAAPEPDFVGYDAGSPALRDQIAHEHREEHRQLQAHAQALRDLGVDCTALLIRGSTADAILREAERLAADLIVMATHGHGAMFDLLVGSISHAVLRQGKVPVVMVPVR